MIHSIFGIKTFLPPLSWSFPSTLFSLVNHHLKTEKTKRTLIPEYIAEEKKPSLLSRLITKIFQWIFFPFRFLHGLLCHCHYKSPDWIDDLRKPGHQGEFSPQKSFFIQARFHFLSFLTDIGAPHPKNSLSSRILPDWDPVDIFKLSDEKLYSWGSFSLSGKELKFLAKSLIVSYDPSIISPHSLAKILTRGSTSANEERKARGRMISSLAVSLRNSLGTPLSRGEKEALPYYRIYSSQFPDLMHNSEDQFEFISDNTLKREQYQKEIGRILYHFFKEAQNNEDDTLVIPGFPLEPSVPESLHSAAVECFAIALKECIHKEGAHFKEIIYADPDLQAFQQLRSCKIKIKPKNCLDIAHHGAKKGYRVAIFYPTGPRSIPGQCKPAGKITLSQMFGYYTTLLTSQHFGCNPLVKKSQTFVPLKKNAHP